MSAASVPMNPEGFGAMIARHVRTWGKKLVAVVRKPGRFISRVASRLHVTQAVRWTASLTATVATKVWSVAKWVLVPAAAVFYTQEFFISLLVVCAVFLMLENFQLWRLRKRIKEEAPGSKVTFRKLMQAVWDVERQVNAQVHYIPVPEPEEEPEPVVEEVVEETTEVIETNPVEVEEVIEETVEPVDDGVIIVEEEVYDISDAPQRHPVTTEELITARDAPRAELPDETEGKPLPVPYPILSKRWLGLAEMADEAHEVGDEDLYSEIVGRMSVVMIRTGNPDVKLKPDAPWNKIHQENRKVQEEKRPDFAWNWTRMSRGARAEDTLLKELAEQAKADESAA